MYIRFNQLLDTYFASINPAQNFVAVAVVVEVDNMVSTNGLVPFLSVLTVMFRSILHDPRTFFLTTPWNTSLNGL